MVNRLCCNPTNSLQINTQHYVHQQIAISVKNFIGTISSYSSQPINISQLSDQARPGVEFRLFQTTLMYSPLCQFDRLQNALSHIPTYWQIKHIINFLEYRGLVPRSYLQKYLIKILLGPGSKSQKIKSKKKTKKLLYKCG